MSGKPAARQGDPTQCPKDGHGSHSITAGSADVLFNGLPAARLGDPTSCGSTLSGQVIPGQRHTLWSGVIEQPFTLLAIELGMRLDVAAMGDWSGGNFGVEPAFELELLP